MTSRDFCYWLQGMFELENPKKLGERQTQLIKRHLAMVFKHEIDPSMGDEEHQKALDQIHNPAQGEGAVMPADFGPGHTFPTRLMC